MEVSKHTCKYFNAHRKRLMTYTDTLLHSAILTEIKEAAFIFTIIISIMAQVFWYAI